MPQLENSLKEVTWGNLKNHLPFCLSHSCGPLPFMSSVSKTVAEYLIIFVAVISGGKEDQVSINPS